MPAVDKKTEYLAAIVALLIPVVTGTLWIGSVSSTANSAESQVRELRDDLKAVPADVAVLKSQAETLKQQLEQIRQEQKAQNDALLAAIKAKSR
jgi:septal ring factor EnvC (AmiA/AmiB activator)